MESSAILTSLTTVGAILASMATVALLETALPLRARGRWNRAHLGPNLALTFLTFATNAVFNVALVMALAWLQASGLGLLQAFSPQPLLEVGIVLLVLDFSFYVAHVAMHKLPGFWRFHRVHHSDPAVDVTTTIRQHPGESVLRYAFLAVFACVLGASPGAFAVYRAASAINGLFEHANLRLPAWLDRLLALVTTWPNLHKIHHSRAAAQTDTNYSNLFSIWDRLFSTFTPSREAAKVVYGLAEHDDPATQTAAGLLALPFRAGKLALPSRAGEAPGASLATATR
jgi:sterol desaturase/sphingolipid hydroxylase (fatty acid hydroxylase superfamily)